MSQYQLLSNIICHICMCFYQLSLVLSISYLIYLIIFPRFLLCHQFQKLITNDKTKFPLHIFFISSNEIIIVITFWTLSIVVIYFIAFVIYIAFNLRNFLLVMYHIKNGQFMALLKHNKSKKKIISFNVTQSHRY